MGFLYAPALGAAAGCGSGACVLHIFDVPVGRRPVEKRGFHPKMVGAAALVLAILAFAIVALASSKVTGRAEEVSYRAYRILIHGILVLIVVFFLFGDRIIWINWLTGFAWRTWLLLYVLPAWIAVKNHGGPQAPQHN